MGVLNVTPDSFSDAGSFSTTAEALDAAGRMALAGADIVDVGGESTRPGAVPVDADEEAMRILPVIEGIKKRHRVRISVDTRKAAVAARAVDAGADMINDVSGLADPGMIDVARRSDVPVVVMHMKGTPQTMQRATHYHDIVAEVVDYLRRRIELAVEGGLSGDKIIVDPGIGFGKSATGNLTLLERIPALAAVGRPILVGASRKSFIGNLLNLPVGERLEPSLAVAAYAASRGVHVIRAHDVAATVRTVRMIDAIRDASGIEQPSDLRGHTTTN